MFLYNKNLFDKFKYKFEGLENIDESYSQCLQDMFVLAVLNGEKNSTYLEIGANDPIFINNTYLLESKFGWTGISIDIDPATSGSFENSGRTSKVVINDALLIDYKKLFEENKFDKRIGYLSLDIDPNFQTFNCLKLLPLDEYRFSVITYETDVYDMIDGSEERRDQSRDILKSYGYELVCGNISNMSTNDPMEDWYVDREVISQKTIDRIKKSDDLPMMARSYMIEGL